MKQFIGIPSSPTGIKLGDVRVNDCNHLSCSWAEEVPDAPSNPSVSGARRRICTLPVVIASVLVLGCVIFATLAARGIVELDGRAHVNKTGKGNFETKDGPRGRESLSESNCRLVILFSKTGHEAATDASYSDVWREFVSSSSHAVLKEACEVFEFDARSDPATVLDVVVNFLSPAGTSVFVGIGDFGLTEDLERALRNTSSVLYSPQSRIPGSMPAVLPSANQMKFKTRVDAVLAKATAMGVGRILPVVCDGQTQVKQFASFLEAAAGVDLRILPPVVAVSSHSTDADKDSGVLTFCGRNLPSALLWAKLSSPRLLTRPWFTLDAVDYPELAENDVVSKQVGPGVGLFTPFIESEGKEEFRKFLSVFVDLVRRGSGVGLATALLPGSKNASTLASDETNEVRIAWIPLLSRKSGRAVMIRSQSWSVDSLISFSRKGGKLSINGVRVPTLGQVSRTEIEGQLKSMGKSCGSYWIAIHVADPLSLTGTITTEAFLQPGVDVGAPETLLFFMDEFRGEVVCLKGGNDGRSENLKIVLKCSAEESICKHMILSDVHVRPTRAIKAVSKSETAVLTRNLLNRLAQYVQATSPCVGTGLFCVLCFNVAGNYATDITMTSCAAACLTTAATSCVGLVMREGGSVLRQGSELIG